GMPTWYPVRSRDNKHFLPEHESTGVPAVTEELRKIRLLSSRPSAVVQFTSRLFHGFHYFPPFSGWGMAWQRNYVVLKTGERVRYSFVLRGASDVYRVRFKGEQGKLVELSTGCTGKVDAIGEAHRLILEHYAQRAPAAERMPWEEARKKLQEAMLAGGKRPRTVSEYLKSLKYLAAMFPLAKGPADVTDRMAGDFKTKYATGRTVRKKNLKQGEQAPAYERRPQTLGSQLRMLKAAFTW